MNKNYYSEGPGAGLSYRAAYLQSVQQYIKAQKEQAVQRRAAFITPEKLALDREGYRRKFIEMLGYPLTEYETLKQIPVTCVEDTFAARDDECEIRRIRLRVIDDLCMYGLLFLPLERPERVPFVISQHGGIGTAELCSGLCGDTANYNHQTRRVTARGAAVFAPQLLLANSDPENQPEYNHNMDEIDHDLKRIGSSLAALHTFCLMRCIDYFSAQPWCDTDRIGMIGLSWGGFFTMTTAAVDVRIRSAYASCSFVDTNVHNWNSWTWNNSAATFLEAEITALVAPRSICFDAGENDELFACDDPMQEYKRAKPFFEAQNAGDQIFMKLFPGTHELDPADDCMNFFFDHLIK